MTPVHERGNEPLLDSIHAMFHPASIAIVGASERLGYGGHFLNNLLTKGSQARLYPVNPNRDVISGLRCYRSVRDIPEPVDLVAIILPAEQIVPVFKDCIANKARSVLVVSAGFAEQGTPAGIARQQELQAIARESGIRVCGPNCLGMANVATNSWTTSSPRIAPENPPLTDAIGLVSQSGATCYSMLLETARDRRIGFRYLVATGNEADLESSDFIRYMLHDPEIKVVAAVVEGFKDGDNFIRTAEMAVRMGKPIVLLKIGRSEAGSRGASSHTAAMTGSDVVQDALFVQKGVVRVDDYDELLETAAMFAKVSAPRGNRVGAVSESGGMASHLADKCGEVGLDVPPLSPLTREKLVAIMGERGSAANPADLTLFGSNEELFPVVLGHFLAEAQQDLFIMSSIGGEVQARGVVAAAANCDKPLLFVWNGSMHRKGLDILQESRVALFYHSAKAVRAAKRLVDYHRTRRSILAEDAVRGQTARRDAASEDSNAVSMLLKRSRGLSLPEHESKLVLSKSGVCVTSERFCRTVEEACQAARQIGYPVVLKVASGQISHKTEAGGVRLGIADDEALTAAYAGIMASVRAYRPDAVIDGVLVQQMVTGGVELIAGVSRDVQFGPVLMLGMGGILAEALGKAAWRVCPVTPREANEMIDEIAGLRRIMSGFRGLPEADIDALVDALVKVSELAAREKDSIESMDINPLTILPKGKGAVALDALIVTAAA